MGLRFTDYVGIYPGVILMALLTVVISITQWPSETALVAIFLDVVKENM